MAISTAPLNGSGLGEAFIHSSASTSNSATLAAAPSTGDVLVLLASAGTNTQRLTAITQTNVTWALVGRSNTNLNAEIWVGVAAASASATINITSLINGTTVNIRYNVSRWSGDPEQVDVTGSNSSGTATTAVTSTSLTPTAGKNMLLVVAERSQSGGVSAPGGSFTALTSGSTGYAFAFRVITSTSGAYQATWAQTSGTFETFIAALKVPTAGTNPVASITTPANNSTNVAPGVAVSFAGTGTDAEDGTLTGSSLVWTSNLDGQIGVGTSFSKSNLSVGVHTITLTVLDSSGRTGTASRTVTITQPSGSIVSRTVNYTATNGTVVTGAGFKVFVPAGFDNSRRNPCIMVLGGSGQRGTDNTSQMSDGLATRVQANLSTWPTLTIFPQWPAIGSNGGREWAYPMIAAVQAAVESEWNIDTSKRYLTGFSLGALVAFEYLWQQPTMYAAVLAGEGYVNANALNLTTPVSPLTDRHAADMVAAQVGALPIRHYLSDGDTTLNMQSGSLDTKAAFTGVDPNYVFVQLSGLSHTSAYMAMYNDDAAFTWLYAQGARVDSPVEFDTTRKPSDFGGTKWTVTTPAELQAALDGCQDRDEIWLQPGTVFAGQFTLRNRGTTGWVEIRTGISPAALDAVCPQGTRMDPTKAGTLNLATIRNTASNGGIKTDLAVRGYRFTAVQFDSSVDVAGIIRFGENYVTSADICSYLGLDRCYAPGSTTLKYRRLVNGVCSYGFVKDSYIAKMVDVGTDSQAIAIYGCKGPWLVENNYGEGWGELIIVGGANTMSGSNPDSTPSDVVIRGNYFRKDLSIKNVGLYTYAKNGLELKSVNRCLVENNIIENTFRDDQVGYGILIKTDVSQDSTRIYGGSRNIEVRNNWVRNVACGLQIVANPDGTANDIPVNRVWVHDNLFENINKSPDNIGDGVVLALDGDLKDIYVEHNTFVKCFPGGNIGVRLGAPGAVASGNMFVRSNFFSDNTYGIKQDSGPGNQAAITNYFAGASSSAFTQNVVSNRNQYNDNGAMPAGNTGVANDGLVGYTDWTNGNYSLASGSPFKGAGHDGNDIGISNWSTFQANLLGVDTGTFTAPPAAVATSIVFTTQPGNGNNDIPLPTPPSGQVLDQYGVLKSDYNGSITLVGVGATVTAGGTVNVVNGQWTATGLTLTAGATTAFTLQATSPSGLNGATSASATLTVATSVPTNTVPKRLPNKTAAKAGKTLVLLWFF